MKEAKMYLTLAFSLNSEKIIHLNDSFNSLPFFDVYHAFLLVFQINLDNLSY
jgi:hypothetical protein